LTTNDGSALSAAGDIPHSHYPGAFQAPLVVLPRESRFAIAGGLADPGRLAMHDEHERRIDSRAE
jgi:hypothetical protein